MRMTIRGLVAALLLAAPLPLAAQNPTPPPPPVGPPPVPGAPWSPGMGPGMGHDMMEPGMMEHDMMGPGFMGGMMGPGFMGPGMGRGMMGPGFMGPDMRQGPMGIFLADPVQRLLDMKTRLGLTPDQVSRLQAIQSRFKSQNQGTLDQLQKAHDAMRAQMLKQHEALLGGRKWQDLKPEERQELRQKMLQQRTQLRDAMAKHRDAMLPLIQKLQQARTAQRADIQGVLRPDQQDHLRLMIEERLWMRRGMRQDRGMPPGAGPRAGMRDGRGMRDGAGMWPGAAMRQEWHRRPGGSPPAPPDSSR